LQNIRGVDEEISVRGNGYQSELSDIYIDKDYSSTAVEDIVDDIMDTFVVPNTNITKGTIAATGFTPDTWEVNTDALRAIQQLADLVGTREWGVNASRQFNFQARSTSVGFRYPFGKNVISANIDNSGKEIINRVIVTGGDVAGSPFTRVVDNAKSQLKWKRRDKAVQNSAIVTNAVADQFADAIFAELTNVSRRARVRLQEEIQIESTIPIPEFELITSGDTYGTKRYGEGLYNKIESYQVSRVKYNLNNTGNLIIDLQLGERRPELAEKLSQVEFRIEQLRQQGV
jgi:hypothetical protein